MKALIYSIIVLALSVIVWLQWGGLTNDLGTLIIALADVFIINVIVDNFGKKTPADDKSGTDIA